jgi:hypothetical protein
MASNHRVRSPPEPVGPDSARRLVLAAVAGTYASSLIPWALAQPVRDADTGAFVALSALLVGRPSLDPALARRLYEALAADNAGFPASAQALLAFINEHKVDPSQLQPVLDAAKSPLAALPRTIMTAWCLGIVGSGDKARCLAFEDALNARMVADVLKPPTYAYGPHGSWSRKPT